jgi:VCBS repeat-containing protein
MADLYLASGDLLTGLTFGGHVYGATGSEGVAYVSGVRGAIIDQNVEAVQLAGSVSSFTYQRQGNNLVIYNAAGTAEVARVVLQDDASGTTIRFSDGAFQATVSQNGMRIGGIDIEAAAPAPLIDPNTQEPWTPPVETRIDAGVASNIQTQEDGVITGKLVWAGASGGELPRYFSPRGAEGLPGFFLEPDGSFTFDTRGTGYQALTEGETREYRPRISATDSRGNMVTLDLAFVVKGVNDAPYAENDSAAVVEAGRANDGTALAGIPIARGNVIDNDNPIDGGNSTRVVNAVQYGETAGKVGADLVGAYGKVNIAQDGSFTYTLNNTDPDTQALAEGAQSFDTFLYKIQDASGSTSEPFAQLSIKVSGTNDAPVAGDETFVVPSGATTLGLHVATNDTDDDFSKLSYAVVGTAPAGVSLSREGFATVDATLDAYKDLKPGESEVVTLTYVVTDQFGLSDVAKAAITIQGITWG